MRRRPQPTKQYKCIKRRKLKNTKKWKKTPNFLQHCFINLFILTSKLKRKLWTLDPLWNVAEESLKLNESLIKKAKKVLYWIKRINSNLSEKIVKYLVIQFEIGRSAPSLIFFIFSLHLRSLKLPHFSGTFLQFAFSRPLWRPFEPGLDCSFMFEAPKVKKPKIENWIFDFYFFKLSLPSPSYLLIIFHLIFHWLN